MCLPKARQTDDTNRNGVKRKANLRTEQKQFSVGEQRALGQPPY